MSDSILYARAFWGLMVRDISVLRREFIAFMVRTVMNPLMFVFVFTYLFPKMGQDFQNARGISFGTLILPGLVAVAIFVQGIMGFHLKSVQLARSKIASCRRYRSVWWLSRKSFSVLFKASWLLWLFFP